MVMIVVKQAAIEPEQIVKPTFSTTKKWDHRIVNTRRVALVVTQIHNCIIVVIFRYFKFWHQKTINISKQF